jgi:ABC-type hemin transport system ATPase subunit
LITRRYDLPDHSFFLFGPRGTGKTTWLKHVLPDALWFDLLRTQVVLALSRQFFPLTASELGYDVSVDRVLQFGLLPEIRTEIDHAVDVLAACLAQAGERQGGGKPDVLSL